MHSDSLDTCVTLLALAIEEFETTSFNQGCCVY